MNKHHKGIHHITALSGDAQRNADFYVKSLGMRLVKKSVNQDDLGISGYDSSFTGSRTDG
ncbi:MAG: VOC family protein [Balneolaceae bacterium]